VTTEPASQTKNPGETATFTSTASGDPTPTIQWFANFGSGFVILIGQTSTVLSIASVAESDEGDYQAVFTNSAGSDTSTDSTLSVNDPPVVTTNPVASQTKNPGESATFTSTASGDPTPSVQWFANFGSGFVILIGQTSTVLSIASVAESDDGTYQAVFTNSAGASLSDKNLKAAAKISEPLNCWCWITRCSRCECSCFSWILCL